jgi:hypothetical protein
MFNNAHQPGRLQYYNAKIDQKVGKKQSDADATYQQNCRQYIKNDRFQPFRVGCATRKGGV